MYSVIISSNNHASPNDNHNNYCNYNSCPRHHYSNYFQRHYNRCPHNHHNHHKLHLQLRHPPETDEDRGRGGDRGERVPLAGG